VHSHSTGLFFEGGVSAMRQAAMRELVLGIIPMKRPALYRGSKDLEFL
jgi:hypothetical protein